MDRQKRENQLSVSSIISISVVKRRTLINKFNVPIFAFIISTVSRSLMFFEVFFMDEGNMDRYYRKRGGNFGDVW